MIFSEKNTDRKLTMFETRLRKRGLRSELKSFQRLRFFYPKHESGDVKSKLDWIYANADAALKLRMEHYFEQHKEVTGLLASLTEQTKDFKAKHLDEVEEWAKAEAAHNRERKARYKWMMTQETMDNYKKRLAEDNNNAKTIAFLKKEIENGFVVTQEVMNHETRWAHSTRAETDEAKMIKQCRKQAKQNFELGLVKMVDRIHKKGMIADQCVISNIKMDVNIRATVTDGNKEVNLYTIIASGPIQRPHYRYLCH